MKLTTSKEKEFLQIISLIQTAKQKAFLAVNTEIIDLYWNIGEHISKKIKSAQWGESQVVLSSCVSKILY